MYAPPLTLAPHLAVQWGLVARGVRWGVRLFAWYQSSPCFPPRAEGSLPVVIGALVNDGRLRIAGLLEKHYGLLRLVALRLARTTDQADDLAQQAAVAALSASARLRSDEAFVAWCRTAMAHALVDKRRALQREVLGFQDVREALSAGGGPAAMDPLEQAVTKADVLRALATLPEPARRVVVLVDLMGMDYHAAARVLGVPVGTVRSRLHRARGFLRRYLLG